MNSNLSKLHPYPFQKIAELYSGVSPVDIPMVSLAIGEPKHKTPDIILDAIQENLAGFSNYPLTAGSLALRSTIADWLTRRFNLEDGLCDPVKNVLPVNGTREALFAFAQAVVDIKKPNAKIVMPNPFYQIYEGAAFLAGAEPVFLACTEDNQFIPNFDDVSDDTWNDCQLVYIAWFFIVYRNDRMHPVCALVLLQATLRYLRIFYSIAHTMVARCPSLFKRQV